MFLPHEDDLREAITRLAAFLASTASATDKRRRMQTALPKPSFEVMNILNDSC